MCHVPILDLSNLRCLPAYITETRISPHMWSFLPRVFRTLLHSSTSFDFVILENSLTINLDYHWLTKWRNLFVNMVWWSRPDRHYKYWSICLTFWIQRILYIFLPTHTNITVSSDNSFTSKSNVVAPTTANVNIIVIGDWR